jgi:hypothetical protein
MPLLAVVFCIASGGLLVALTWPHCKASLSERVLKLSLSLGFGLAIFSVEFFFERLLGINHAVWFDAGCMGLLFVLYLIVRRRHARVIAAIPEMGDLHIPGWIRRALAAAFVVALLATMYSAVLRVIAHPHGEGWDAFSIWNLRARFLFLGGANWRDGFTTLLPWSHPDYPLLVPAAIAHFWSYLGHDEPIVAATIGIVFAFGTLALLVSALAHLHGRNAALLAGLALTATPFFIEQGTSQYADVPLSFFILASIVLLHIGQNHAGALLLAGMAAGFAAWTKNEGLLYLFALVIGLVRAVFLANDRDASADSPHRKWRIFIWFLSGAAPVTVVIALFKHYVGTTGDLFSSPGVMIHKLLTPGRYWVTLRWFAKESLRFGAWWIVPGTVVMVVFYLLVRRKQASRQDPLYRGSVLALGLTLIGYFAIYLITPRDLYWHLRFSLNRLFLQLWPATIFLFFLFVARQSCAISQVSHKDTQSGHSC